MENHSFEYTYSPKRQQEVEAIRKAYLPREEDKMEQLRKLHSIPDHKAQSASIAIGVTGALVLGTGMSLCMTDLAAAWGVFAMLLGVLTGLVGITLISLAYPVYKRILEKERKKIAPEILRLTDEMLRA